MSIDLNLVAPALAAALTALGAALVTYLTMRRAKSGQINSTEADQLWKESTGIRRELREQVQSLDTHIIALDTQIAGLRSENAALKYEVLTLRAENAALKIQVDRLSGAGTITTEEVTHDG